MGFASRYIRRRFLAAMEGVRHGRLRLVTPDGTVHHFGDGGDEIDLILHDWSVIPAIAARGDVGLGETWVEGLWTTNSLEGLLTLALRNVDHLADWSEPRGLSRLKMLLSDRVVRLNSLRGSSRNIRAHYDVGNEFYQLWLDPGMTYSSALFDDQARDLDRAQARKNDRILSRLGPGESILEIGCGWGGFAEAAADRGRHVTGLTLSPAQKGYADARLDGRAEIRLQDYRQAQGRFDNIVSIEMIEAVGERYWPTYFGTIKARLAEGGRAVLQAITVPDAEFSLYRKRSDFIRQHTFPGGMLPCNAVIAREAARAGLVVRDTFAFGPDYARTCRIWAGRMLAERPRILRFGYDDRFLRSWQFYLEGCAATFSTARTDVVQVELAHAGEAA
ncbi:cyclopropane-fatty-acyl-phospholipid synthase [Gemmobacter megaterium]|uniref:Cyclopropane-fatty-acyl-phospholipid synthase n=1 Tax=Gemmobacter megaterium TaxID=1086013 RepID=A0A1N7PDD4_9RHOB|nr:cyclopropane-fatty-acyl-phospholipid synthase family protein [Gemmobacter megaterium]GGE18984.1 cyclopropane-fatty-acyl-phospholipid synthase [Gemmobacter megaterium]SIT08537.1 cyclopropane-fatty-acyl-phospholipid synthase [Gemmobacter megaterium]